MSKITKLEKDLAVAKDLLKSADNAVEKKIMEDEIAEIEGKIAKEKETPSGSSKPAKAKKGGAKEKSSDSKKKKSGSGYKMGDKDLDDITCEEAIAAVKKRMDSSRKSGKKAKTTPAFTKISEQLTGVAKASVKSVSAAAIKEDPQGAIKAFEKVGDIIEDAKEKIGKVLKPFLESKDQKESAEAKKDMEEFDKLISGLKKKYVKE